MFTDLRGYRLYRAVFFLCLLRLRESRVLLHLFTDIVTKTFESIDLLAEFRSQLADKWVEPALPISHTFENYRLRPCTADSRYLRTTEQRGLFSW
jgi:hypothetical protein